MLGLGPPELIIIAIVILALFGYKKLPDAARAIGRSARILKAETRGLREDPAPRDLQAKAEAEYRRDTTVPPAAPTTAPTTPPPTTPPATTPPPTTPPPTTPTGPSTGATTAPLHDTEASASPTPSATPAPPAPVPPPPYETR